VIASLALVLALTAPSAPTEEVDDTVGAMSRAARAKVEAEIEAFDKRTGDQVIVYIGSSTNGEPLEAYTNHAASAWKIGQRGRDNGVILFIFKQDRRVRIEVGYGLEHVLTDAQSSRIINDDIVPALTDDDYDRGVQAGVGAMLSTLGASGASDASPDAPISNPQPFNPIFALFNGIGAIFNGIGFGIWWIFRATGRLTRFITFLFLAFVVLGLAYVFVSDSITGLIARMRHEKRPADDADDGDETRPASKPKPNPQPKPNLNPKPTPTTTSKPAPTTTAEASAAAAPFTDKWGVWHENHSLDAYDAIDRRKAQEESSGGFSGIGGRGGDSDSGGGFSGGGGSFGGGGASGSF